MNLIISSATFDSSASSSVSHGDSTSGRSGNLALGESEALEQYIWSKWSLVRDSLVKTADSSHGSSRGDWVANLRLKAGITTSSYQCSWLTSSFQSHFPITSSPVTCHKQT